MAVPLASSSESIPCFQGKTGGFGSITIHLLSIHSLELLRRLKFKRSDPLADKTRAAFCAMASGCVMYGRAMNHVDHFLFALSYIPPGDSMNRAPIRNSDLMPPFSFVDELH